MIDVFSEQLIALGDVPDQLPERRGKKIHQSTVFRWVQRGCRGKRLETARLGGVLYTSREALNRFFATDSTTAGTSRRDGLSLARRSLDAAKI